MTRSLTLMLATVFVVPAAAQQVDSASFVTLLGVDTLAVERFVVGPAGIEAEVVLRAPRTSVGRYSLVLDEDGGLTRYEGTVWQGPSPTGDPTMRETAVRDGDSYAYERTGRRATTGSFPSDGSVLPFIDMVHWPFELMLRRAHLRSDEEVAQPLFWGTRTLPFVIIRRGDDEFGVRHPSRGTMDVKTDSQGRMTSLDAGQTTRALVVRRGSWIELAPLAQSFASREGEGRSFGALSGRGKEAAAVHGARITVDYGTPKKRGREIFGGLLEWGALWRTGANQSTHITTDRDLILGGLEVPAGAYTLFTIPEPEGGLLIVSTETGQSGTAYKPELDLGRVRMEHTQQVETAEVFTIRVRPTDDGGVLELLWDRDVFSIPFQVR